MKSGFPRALAVGLLTAIAIGLIDNVAGQGQGQTTKKAAPVTAKGATTPVRTTITTPQATAPVRRTTSTTARATTATARGTAASPTATTRPSRGTSVPPRGTTQPPVVTTTVPRSITTPSQGITTPTRRNTSPTRAITTSPRAVTTSPRAVTTSPRAVTTSQRNTTPRQGLTTPSTAPLAAECNAAGFAITLAQCQAKWWMTTNVTGSVNINPKVSNLLWSVVKGQGMMALGLVNQSFSNLYRANQSQFMAYVANISGANLTELRWWVKSTLLDTMTMIGGINASNVSKPVAFPMNQSGPANQSDFKSWLINATKATMYFVDTLTSYGKMNAGNQSAMIVKWFQTSGLLGSDVSNVSNSSDPKSWLIPSISAADLFLNFVQTYGQNNTQTRALFQQARAIINSTDASDFPLQVLNCTLMMIKGANQSNPIMQMFAMFGMNSSDVKALVYSELDTKLWMLNLLKLYGQNITNQLAMVQQALKVVNSTLGPRAPLSLPVNPVRQALNLVGMNVSNVNPWAYYTLDSATWLLNVLKSFGQNVSDYEVMFVPTVKLLNSTFGSRISSNIPSNPVLLTLNNLGVNMSDFKPWAYGSLDRVSLLISVIKSFGGNASNCEMMIQQIRRALNFTIGHVGTSNTAMMNQSNSLLQLLNLLGLNATDLKPLALNALGGAAQILNALGTYGVNVTGLQITVQRATTMWNLTSDPLRALNNTITMIAMSGFDPLGFLMPSNNMSGIIASYWASWGYDTFNGTWGMYNNSFGAQGTANATRPMNQTAYTMNPTYNSDPSSWALDVLNGLQMSLYYMSSQQNITQIRMLIKQAQLLANSSRYSDMAVLALSNAMTMHNAMNQSCMLMAMNLLGLNATQLNSLQQSVLNTSTIIIGQLGQWGQNATAMRSWFNALVMLSMNPMNYSGQVKAALNQSIGMMQSMDDSTIALNALQLAGFNVVGARRWVTGVLSQAMIIADTVNGPYDLMIAMNKSGFTGYANYYLTMAMNGSKADLEGTVYSLVNSFNRSIAMLTNPNNYPALIMAATATANFSGVDVSQIQGSIADVIEAVATADPYLVYIAADVLVGLNFSQQGLMAIGLPPFLANKTALIALYTNYFNFSCSRSLHQPKIACLNQWMNRTCNPLLDRSQAVSSFMSSISNYYCSNGAFNSTLKRALDANVGKVWLNSLLELGGLISMGVTANSTAQIANSSLLSNNRTLANCTIGGNIQPGNRTIGGNIPPGNSTMNISRGMNVSGVEVSNPLLDNITRVFYQECMSQTNASFGMLSSTFMADSPIGIGLALDRIKQAVTPIVRCLVRLGQTALPRTAASPQPAADIRLLVSKLGFSPAALGL